MPKVTGGGWSAQQEQALLKGLEEHGQSFDLIRQNYLPHLTVHQVGKRARLSAFKYIKTQLRGADHVDALKRLMAEDLKALQKALQDGSELQPLPCGRTVHLAGWDLQQQAAFLGAVLEHDLVIGGVVSHLANVSESRLRSHFESYLIQAGRHFLPAIPPAYHALMGGSGSPAPASSDVPAPAFIKVPLRKGKGWSLEEQEAFLRGLLQYGEAANSYTLVHQHHLPGRTRLEVSAHGRQLLHRFLATQLELPHHLASMRRVMAEDLEAVQKALQDVAELQPLPCGRTVDLAGWGLKEQAAFLAAALEHGLSRSMAISRAVPHACSTVRAHSAHYLVRNARHIFPPLPLPYDYLLPRNIRVPSPNTPNTPNTPDLETSTPAPSRRTLKSAATTTAAPAASSRRTLKSAAATTDAPAPSRSTRKSTPAPTTVPVAAYQAKLQRAAELLIQMQLQIAKISHTTSALPPSAIPPEFQSEIDSELEAAQQLHHQAHTFISKPHHLPLIESILPILQSRLKQALQSLPPRSPTAAAAAAWDQRHAPPDSPPAAASPLPSVSNPVHQQDLAPAPAAAPAAAPSTAAAHGAVQAAAAGAAPQVVKDAVSESAADGSVRLLQQLAQQQQLAGQIGQQQGQGAGRPEDLVKQFAQQLAQQRAPAARRGVSRGRRRTAVTTRDKAERAAVVAASLGPGL